MIPPPLITVVLCTYNRADIVERTLSAVLAQEGCSFEVVVVDDGSTDATPKVLAAIEDSKLRGVRQDNAGLSAARNAGLAVAAGFWVVFLDDDDVPNPGWLAALAGPTDDPTVGISCCGAMAVDSVGNEIWPLPIGPLGEPFGDAVGSYRAGTFAVRTDLCRKAGGYLDGLGTSHQFELFIRLLAGARRLGLTVASTDVLALNIERRAIDHRLSSNPHTTYDATMWILTRHHEAFAGHTIATAAFESVAGTAAARIGYWSAARQHFRHATRLEPKHLWHWGRLALAHVPALGRWVWDRHGDIPDPIKAGLRLQAIDRSRAPELFLDWGYQENAGLDREQAGSSSTPWAHRIASRVARRHPDVILCLGMLERDENPVELLQRLGGDSTDAAVLIATPDRALNDPDRPLGPPTNLLHRREWTHDQLRLLLRSTGYRVERSWRRGPELVVLARRTSESLKVGG